MPTVEIANSPASCLVKAEQDATSSKLWFKTRPLDRTFCYRAVQLQLCTDSCDQGYYETDSLVPGCWSWFEIIILPDEISDTPRVRDGKELVWRSHGNRMDPRDTPDTISRCYGRVFDRREEILDALEIGNVIGVRVCARYSGWINDARQGQLIAKVLDEDIFSPMSWTLSSPETPDIPTTIENGVYTLVSTSETHIKSQSSEIISQIWFTSPVLDQFIVSRIQDIQLYTVAHHQEHVGDDVAGKWSWFDLVLLDSPESTEPKVKDGRSLVWFSHTATAEAEGDGEQRGSIFSSEHEILKLAQPGNVIGVRVCAQFAGWETHAHSARLVVRISNKGPRRPPSKPTVDWESILRENAELQKKLQAYLEAVNDRGDHATISIESELLNKELRADLEYGAGDRPLRLLSLDGGGVRGISSLYTLKAIMGHITGDVDAKPCDYFDMMAGTSTGGIIAIMLGRLRMTVDQCIDAYTRLSSKIFEAGILSKATGLATTGARYSEKALENAIKEVVKQYTGDEDAPMRDPRGDSCCRVFVLACRADDLSNHVATHLRTYVNPNVEKSFADYKIWEAARATSAAPTYFPRMKLGDYEYVDGGVGFNNPVLLLMGEARVYYGFARQFGCLTTIGTGMTPNVALPAEGTNVFDNVVGAVGLVESMWELATKAEHANQMAMPLVAPGAYYRFNVGVKVAEKRWIEKVDPPLFQRWFGEEPKEVERLTPENWANITIDLADYKGMGKFVELTKEYLKGEEQRLVECATKLPPKRTKS